MFAHEFNLWFSFVASYDKRAAFDKFLSAVFGDPKFVSVEFNQFGLNSSFPHPIELLQHFVPSGLVNSFIKVNVTGNDVEGLAKLFLFPYYTRAR